MSLASLIVRLSHNPFNSDLNFDVAQEYLQLNQTASAVSFYLRCAEYGGENNPKVYASLLKMAQCFDDQKGREYSVTNCLLQALAYDDCRPEAYLLLSRYHERMGNWQECYTFASIGYGWSFGSDPIPADVGYYGSYCLRFQMGIAAWWIGRKEESLSILRALSNQDLHPTYTSVVQDNLDKINACI
jgi:hypothetical protein